MIITYKKKFSRWCSKSEPYVLKKEFVMFYDDNINIDNDS